MNRYAFLTLSLLTGAALVVSCGPTPAAAEQPTESLEPTSTTVFGERLLLFMEHPPLVRDAPARFLAHLTVLATGEPVRSGTVTLEIGSSRFTVEAPKREGLFIPEGSFPAPGTFAGRLVVDSEQASESLDLGEIVVHAAEQEAALAARSEPGSEPAGAVPFLMEQQWKVRLLLAEAVPKAMTRRLAVPAQVRTPEGAEAVISSPVGGRLLAPNGSALPRTGDTVSAGQVVAEVEPPLGAAEIAELRTLRLELDLKALDIVRSLEEARARAEFSRRERDRILKLREQGLSTQQALDEAERDLRIAEGELAGAEATKESLDGLMEQRGPAGATSDLAVRLPIASPLTGTVVTAPQLTGAAIEAGDELFRVLDASRVWIEGHVSEFDLAQLGPQPEGVVTFAALPGIRLDAGGSRPLGRLPFLDEGSRTAVLRCEVPNADGQILPGMLAELEIAIERVQADVTVPLEAIVIDQGLPTAYVMLEGETLQKRDLELGIEDGDRVQVLRGISAGERVATRGSYVVKLAALSPASFGAGHQH